jgi:hypothetical protein
VDRELLKARTKAFAVRVVKMTAALPRRRAADIVARQLIRSATAIFTSTSHTARQNRDRR